MAVVKVRSKSAVSIVCLALLATACGGEEKKAAGAASQTCPPASGDTVNVCMYDVEYVPARVTVPAGGKVIWTNTDSIPHTVTKDEGPGSDFDSQTMSPGTGKFEHAFDEPGRVDYICKIHPNQLGTVVVE